MVRQELLNQAAPIEGLPFLFRWVIMISQLKRVISGFIFFFKTYGILHIWLFEIVGVHIVRGTFFVRGEGLYYNPAQEAGNR